ncbi:MAG: orotidine-5'-phosphate decarboxylase [Candidatus Omnitrophica bacterium]|nr:orotidine-5'-phosphate decarboxylase [Candidatus Omnitrophota bacterium]
MSLIVALDFPKLESCQKLIEELRGLVKFYKVGSELFTAYGWEAVDIIHRTGSEVFLDLKLHDIPITVAKTARIICKKEIFMFNVHTLGGFKMMSEARIAVDEECKGIRKPLLLGVTILTSLSEKELSNELGIGRPLKEEVLDLARLAKRAGLDGVISSPEELQILRKELGKEFVLVTPGVRPVGSDAHDQQRSLTPKEAIRLGAHYLVIGRPIAQASNPRLATQEILQSLA